MNAKKDRLEALIGYYSDGKPSSFAKHLGVAPSTISSWLSRDTFDYDLLFAKCENVSPHWLLSGVGEMLKTDITTEIREPEQVYEAKSVQTAKNEQEDKGIPLVIQSAAAGFGSSAFSIGERDIKDRYKIPLFNERKVDFMIEVSGSSMQPKYNNGDVIACAIIRESHFIQWNKPHVIATIEQGLLVKRIKENDSESILAVSDNKEYPPFVIPKEEITGIAIVVGVVRLE